MYLFKNVCKQTRGYALIVVLLFTTIAVLVGGTMLGVSLSHAQTITYENGNVQAKNVAEVGLKQGLQQVTEALKTQTWGSLTASSFDASSLLTANQINGETLTGTTQGKPSYKLSSVLTAQGSNTELLTLTSIGTVNGTSRSITQSITLTRNVSEGIVIPQDFLNGSLFVNDAISVALKSGAAVINGQNNKNQKMPSILDNTYLYSSTYDPANPPALPSPDIGAIIGPKINNETGATVSAGLSTIATQFASLSSLAQLKKLGASSTNGLSTPPPGFTSIGTFFGTQLYSDDPADDRALNATATTLEFKGNIWAPNIVNISGGKVTFDKNLMAAQCLWVGSCGHAAMVTVNGNLTTNVDLFVNPNSSLTVSGDTFANQTGGNTTIYSNAKATFNGNFDTNQTLNLSDGNVSLFGGYTFIGQNLNIASDCANHSQVNFLRTVFIKGDLTGCQLNSGVYNFQRGLVVGDDDILQGAAYHSCNWSPYIGTINIGRISQPDTVTINPQAPIYH
ncbi:MAG: hypothetical protein ABF586_04680 [Sporolactobacillus sp.]